MYYQERSWPGKPLNTEWRILAKQKLMPAIRDRILAERVKLQVDSQKIAMYNYFASLMGYDYVIMEVK